MKNVAINTATNTFVSTLGENVKLIKTEADLEELNGAALVALYNTVADAPLKKFESRAKGINRIMKLIETNDKIPAVEVAKAAPAKAKKNVAAAAVSVAKVKKARVKRGDTAAIRLVKFAKLNPTGFSLETAEKELGIKATCLRTYMNYVNKNPNAETGLDVKFESDRKSKVYKATAIAK
jgi:hypothetical protein